MILLINCDGSPLCMDLLSGLKERGFPAFAVQDLYRSPAKYSWWLDANRSLTDYRLETGVTISDLDLSAVFLRKSSFMHGPDEALAEATYADAEKEAALLGWVWSLPCPVINRYPPELWFEPVQSLEFWRERVERFGLKLDTGRPEQVIPCYPVAVVGSRVVWDQGAPGRFESINGSLVRFTESLGLGYLECEIVDSMGQPKVARVEPFPKYEGFSSLSRQEIINELIGLLTGGDSSVQARSEFDSWF